jgi:hypothetical protein
MLSGPVQTGKGFMGFEKNRPKVGGPVPARRERVRNKGVGRACSPGDWHERAGPPLSEQVSFHLFALSEI